MRTTFFKRRQKKEKIVFPKTGGFFILYAILFTTVALTIGMGILDIALKQLSFSGIDRESVRAFYAADAGLECALYGDVNLRTLYGNADLRPFSTTTSNTFSCNGTNITVGGAGNPPRFQFNVWINKNTPDENCANVTLERELDGTGRVTRTIISALGYNTQCPGIGAPNRFPFVERGLRTTY